MKNHFFKEIKLKDEIYNLLQSTSTNTYQSFLEIEKVSDDDLIFWTLHSFGEWSAKTYWQGDIMQLEHCSWDAIAKKNIITDTFIDTFNLVKYTSSVHGNNFNPHRHLFVDKNENLIFPYQIVFTYGNGEIEFFEWENKPDDYYEQNEGQDKYWNKPDWAKFKSIFRAPMQNKKVYVFNSYTYHTLHSNEKTRVAVWIPKIKTLEECKQYCEYLESL